jgi:hypothetical protein
MPQMSEPPRGSLGDRALPARTVQRYRGQEQACKRTFSDLTGTLLDGSKRSRAHWMLATFLLCLACSSRRIAREVGVHIRTGYRGCWWLRNAAVSDEMARQLGGRSKLTTSSIPREGPSQAGREKVIGPQATGAPQGARARARPLRQGSARHQRVDPPPGRGRDSSDAGLYRQDGRPRTSPCKRGVSSIRTRPAAIGP